MSRPDKNSERVVAARSDGLKGTSIVNADNIAGQVAVLKGRLATLDHERSKIVDQLSALEYTQASEAADQPSQIAAHVTTASPASKKVALFRSLFRGREDVFPRRWDNPKTGKAGYAPVCRNEWVRGVCGKPQVKCGECPNQAFIPVGDDVLRSHLVGKTAGNSADFTAGVYPMLPDETCWFLAADFDKTVLDAGCCRVPRHRAGEGRSRRNRTIALGQWRSCLDLLRRTCGGG